MTLMLVCAVCSFAYHLGSKWTTTGVLIQFTQVVPVETYVSSHLGFTDSPCPHPHWRMLYMSCFLLIQYFFWGWYKGNRPERRSNHPFGMTPSKQTFT